MKSIVFLLTVFCTAANLRGRQPRRLGAFFIPLNNRPNGYEGALPWHLKHSYFLKRNSNVAKVESNVPKLDSDDTTLDSNVAKLDSKDTKVDSNVPKAAKLRMNSKSKDAVDKIPTATAWSRLRNRVAYFFGLS